MKRRDFLKTAGGVALLPLAGGLASALPMRAGPARFFVMMRVLGGMDATLGLDPWLEATLPDPKDMFVEYRQDELLGGAVKLGPAAAPLLPYASDFSIVNGVFMSQVDNGHDASFDYMTAGTASGAAPALAVELALGSREGDFGVLNRAGVRLGSRSVLTSTLDDLREIPTLGDASAVLEQTSARKSTPLFAAIKAVISSRPALQNFIANLKSFGEPATLTDPQVLAAAFISEVAFQAQIEPSTFFNLDTHGAHPKNHLTEQTKAWQAVADLFQTFKGVPYGGASLFDHTTFMVITEFSRTPALNSANGKDHNPLTNSVLLAGRGVRGGQVIGGSRLVKAGESAEGKSYHIAYPISYTTFDVQRQRTPEARMIFPENVAQTVAEIMGVDFAHFHSLPKDTLSLKPLIKV